MKRVNSYVWTLWLDFLNKTMLRNRKSPDTFTKTADHLPCVLKNKTRHACLFSFATCSFTLKYYQPVKKGNMQINIITFN